MNAVKQSYLASIRANSAYPVYRGFIGTLALLGYAMAGILALGALVSGFGLLGRSVGMGLVVLLGGGTFAAIVFLLAKLSKEAALIVADVADATVDANATAQSSRDAFARGSAA